MLLRTPPSPTRVPGFKSELSNLLLRLLVLPASYWCTPWQAAGDSSSIWVSATHLEHLHWMSCGLLASASFHTDWWGHLESDLPERTPPTLVFQIHNMFRIHVYEWKHFLLNASFLASLSIRLECCASLGSKLQLHVKSVSSMLAVDGLGEVVEENWLALCLLHLILELSKKSLTVNESINSFHREVHLRIGGEDLF